MKSFQNIKVVFPNPYHFCHQKSYLSQNKKDYKGYLLTKFQAIRNKPDFFSYAETPSHLQYFLALFILYLMQMKASITTEKPKL